MQTLNVSSLLFQDLFIRGKTWMCQAWRLILVRPLSSIFSEHFFGTYLLRGPLLYSLFCFMSFIVFRNFHFTFLHCFNHCVFFWCGLYAVRSCLAQFHCDFTHFSSCAYILFMSIYVRMYIEIHTHIFVSVFWSHLQTCSKDNTEI